MWSCTLQQFRRISIHFQMIYLLENHIIHSKYFIFLQDIYFCQHERACDTMVTPSLNQKLLTDTSNYFISSEKVCRNGRKCQISVKSVQEKVFPTANQYHIDQFYSKVSVIKETANCQGTRGADSTDCLILDETSSTKLWFTLCR